MLHCGATCPGSGGNRAGTLLQTGSLPCSFHKSSNFALQWYLLAFHTDLASCFADETEAERQFCEVKPWSSVKGKNGTKVSRTTRAFLCYTTFPSSSFWRNTFSLSFFSGLKSFSPFSLDVKAQPLMWHYTIHGICPGRRLVGARLAMRSQSRCWGWWRCVGNVSLGIPDCQCVGPCVGSMWTCRGCVKEGNELQALHVLATSQGDVISCSMYLGALVRKSGSWEGGTTVCRSRGEQKVPAEDLLQRSACSSARHVVMWEPFRPSEPPCTWRADSAVPWVQCLGRSVWSFGTRVMVITMAWAWDAVMGVGGWECSPVAASRLPFLSISLSIWFLFHSGTWKAQSPVFPSVWIISPSLLLGYHMSMGWHFPFQWMNCLLPFGVVSPRNQHPPKSLLGL